MSVEINRLRAQVKAEFSILIFYTDGCIFSIALHMKDKGGRICNTLKISLLDALDNGCKK